MVARSVPLSYTVVITRQDIECLHEHLSEREFNERRADKIAHTIHHYQQRGWQLIRREQTADQITLYFHHHLPSLW